MGKFDSMKILKKTTARTFHRCARCDNVINKGDVYYSEEIKDKFLHSLHKKKFCSRCYEDHGDNLLKMTKGRWASRSEPPLESFNE